MGPVIGLALQSQQVADRPYARAIDGNIDWDRSCFPYRPGEEDVADDTDSGPHIPKSVVVNPYFDWEGDRHPDVPMDDTVIYEVHVKGFTARHPEIPDAQRAATPGWPTRRRSSTCGRWG